MIADRLHHCWGHACAVVPICSFSPHVFVFFLVSLFLCPFTSEFSDSVKIYCHLLFNTFLNHFTVFILVYFVKRLYFATPSFVSLSLRFTPHFFYFNFFSVQQQVSLSQRIVDCTQLFFPWMKIFCIDFTTFYELQPSILFLLSQHFKTTPGI